MITETIRARTDKVGFRADPEVTWALVDRHREALLANRTPQEERWFDLGAVASLLGSGDRTLETEFLVWRLVSLKLWLRATWGEPSDALRGS